jgi:hypothetical protein
MNNPTVSASETLCSGDDLLTTEDPAPVWMREGYVYRPTEINEEALNLASEYWDRGEELPPRLRKALLTPVPVRRSPQRPRQVGRTDTRSRAPRRSPRRGATKTSRDGPGDADGGDPDSDDPDLDPVERRVRQLVSQAPPLCLAQRQLLARILGGA